VLRARELLDQASRLVGSSASADADYRRAVSASYYSVFHLISAAAAEQAYPPTPRELRCRFQRALEHRSAKSAMQSFVTPDSVKSLAKDLGVFCNFNQDIADIAKAFGELQDARELADYDVVDSEGTVGYPCAKYWFEKPTFIFDAWDRGKPTDEAKSFLAYLIFRNKRR
jgi:hypothetical protein